MQPFSIISFNIFEFILTDVVFALRWAGLLEEIAERLRSSKALLQLWQRYKELYEQGCSSIQRQEEKADQLLKLACSKDIADEEVSDWIQECSVSEATAVTFTSKCSIFLFGRVQQMFFCSVTGGAPVPSSGAGLPAGSP